ncbi:uncharacterized protein [Diadema setosum]|uniref:uncharacterized protein n=1 Tax=Diadema setosum TaxID=31175 RepID=UPI003B3BA1E0
MAEEREVRVSTHSYVSMICLSLFLSSLVYLSVGPSTPVAAKNWSEMCKVIHVLVQIIVALIMAIVLFWFSFTRPKYHKKQTIFWPKQCQHCAQVLGILTRCRGSEPLQVQTRSLHPNSVQSSSDTASRQESSREHLSALDSDAVEGDGSQENQQENDERLEPSESQCSASCSGKLWYLRRKSLAQAMIIMGLIGFILGPLKVFKYILHRDVTLLHIFGDTFVIILMFGVLPASILGIARYHDAVFVDTPLFSAGCAFLCGGFMWLAAFKIAVPIGNLFGNGSCPYSEIYTPDRWDFIQSSLGASAMSMYAQCAIIGTVFLWTIWSSMIRQHTLHLRESNPQIQPFDPPRSRKGIRDSGTNYRMNVIRREEDATSHVGDSEEGGQLLQHERSRQDRLLKPFLRRVLRVSVSAATIYSGSRFAIAIFPNEIISEDAKFLFGAVMNVMLHSPVVILIIYQHHLTRASRGLRQVCGPCAGRAFGGDNLIYLISLFGTFMSKMFSIMAAIALLFLDGSVRGVFYLVYKVLTVWTAWLVSSFVYRVQRQDSSKMAEVKWTLATLLYLGFCSAAQWLKDSWNDSYEPLEVNFFKREVVAFVHILLIPLELMFELMTALLAYERYHILLSRYKENTLIPAKTYGTIQSPR